MRIVNTMCISKEKTVKAVRHFADVIVKVFEENSEITLGGGGAGGRCWMPIKEVQKLRMLRPKLDVCG